MEQREGEAREQALAWGSSSSWQGASDNSQWGTYMGVPQAGVDDDVFYDSEAGTDTDTSTSSGGEEDAPDEFSHLPDHSREQQLLWAYSKAKRTYRRFVGKPNRNL